MRISTRARFNKDKMPLPYTLDIDDAILRIKHQLMLRRGCIPSQKRYLSVSRSSTKRDVQQVACYATPNSRDMLFGLPDPWAHPPQGVTNGPLAGVTTGPLVLVRDDGAHVPPLHAPDHVAVLLAQLPIVGRLAPLSLLERGAVYRVRLVNATHCDLPPCPQGLLQ